MGAQNTAEIIRDGEREASSFRKSVNGLDDRIGKFKMTGVSSGKSRLKQDAHYHLSNSIFLLTPFQRARMIGSHKLRDRRFDPSKRARLSICTPL
jgi:hypothetical protein